MLLAGASPSSGLVRAKPMRDLLLYRLLQSSPLDAGALLPHLRELPAQPLHERAAFLGWLGPALSHEDPEVRRAAVASFAGAWGQGAWAALVEGLNDPEEAVRLAALEALRDSCRNDPMRWAHALFHRDPALRRAALDPAKASPVPWHVRMYLLPDEESRPLLRAELERQGAGRDIVPLLFGFLRDGQLSREEVRHLSRGCSWAAWDAFLGPLLSPADDPTPLLEHLLGASSPHGPVTLEDDRLTEVFSLFWDDPDAPFFDHLKNAALAKSPYLRGWLAYRIFLHGLAMGGWPAPAFHLACVLWPFALACPWLPVDLRRASLSAFYDAGDICPRFPSSRIQPILTLRLLRHPDLGLPDPWSLGAVLHAVEDDPYALLACFRPEDLATALRFDFARGVHLLRVPERGGQGRKAFVEMLTQSMGVNAPDLLALLAAAVPADQLGFLDSMTPEGMLDLFRALLAYEASVKPLGERKVTRLAGRLARALAPGLVGRFLSAWLSSAAPGTSTLAPVALGRMLHEEHADEVAREMAALPTEELTPLLLLIPGIPGFPYEREAELAQSLLGHADPVVSAWASQRASPKEEAPSTPPQSRSGGTAFLASASGPSVSACVALLSSNDPIDQVAEAFARCSSPAPAFVQALDVEMVRLWRGEMGLPFLGHVWLYRWDQHLRHLSGLLSREAPGMPMGGLGASLGWALEMSAPALADRIWLMGARLLDHWRWHEKEQYARALDSFLGDLLLKALPGRHGEVAVSILLSWKEHGPPSARDELERVRQRLALLAGELPEAVRQRLAGWLGAIPSAARRDIPGLARTEDVLKLTPAELEVAASTLDNARAVPAARLLLCMGPLGEERLARALAANPGVTWPLILLAELPLMPPRVKSALEELARSPRGDPQTRFRVGRALWPTPRVGDVGCLIDAVRAEGPAGWLTLADMDWLAACYPGPERELALRLITSPHQAAHGRAVQRLAAESPLGPEARAALLAFLEAGTERMRAFRVQSAEALYAAGERRSVLPVLLGEKPGDVVRCPGLLTGLTRAEVVAAARGMIILGGEPYERLLLALLDHGRDGGPRGWSDEAGPSRVVEPARQEALAAVLEEARTAPVRQEARRLLTPGLGRSRKLRALAQTFAWGVRLGRQLTGELFDLEMTAGEELGYTRFDQPKLFISPLPILRGEQDGREVVKGLILHEYGHHLFHKGPGDKEVWEKASQEKLHPLLNLVSDEHLERNLRSRDEEYGNLIKTLDAYAFQHAAREVEVDGLLSSLGSRAFQVLTSIRLHPGRGEGTVRVSAGGLLHQMDLAGMSFARFLRALRMGLGNRTGDEKVARGLALFKGPAFRSSKMPRMLEVARELRRIFGDEVEALNCVGQDGTLCGQGEELTILGDGITNDELQQAVQRALELPSDPEPEKGRPVRVVNRREALDFPLIDLVQPRAFDPAKYAKYSRRVARLARRLREVLMQLGLALEPRPPRVRGRSLDRSRLLPLVLRSDPRVLTAREVVFRTDLFLGVLIDCSGSMAVDENIEKAKLFAALIAEAARGLRGIDVRFWGFTDRRIYDCGDAGRPAVHDLVASEGNNDSAALYHASQAAKASRRKARLLVMISDGSPTECTVASLRNLVRRLTSRQGVLCAQVAVRPLDDVCFPQYVLLEEGNVDEAVKRFGMVVLRLVRQALGGR
jgi:hypothetical protein